MAEVRRCPEPGCGARLAPHCANNARCTWHLCNRCGAIGDPGTATLPQRYRRWSGRQRTPR